MTCIVGLAYEGAVYIGADRSAVDGWNNFVSYESKIFRLGELLIGTSGSHLILQTLKYELKLSRLQQIDNETDMQYLVTVFAKEARQLLSGLTTKRDEDGEAVFAGGILFGYRSNLYRMSQNYQINLFSRGFDAIGSGAPFALGAISATGQENPVNILMTALRVSSELCCDVTPPFDVEVLTEAHSAEIKAAFLKEISRVPERPAPFDVAKI